MSGKRSQLDIAIGKVSAEIDILQQVLVRLLAERMAKPVRKAKTKPPKPGELRDRAILGVEPSL